MNTRSSKSYGSPWKTRVVVLLAGAILLTSILYSRFDLLSSISSSSRASTVAPFDHNPYDNLPQLPTFTLMSEEVKDGETLQSPQLSKAFGVEGGEDMSPSLYWEGFPPETKSFAVTCYDPDAPTVSGFWHWIMYDIPASVNSLDVGAGNRDGSNLPSGAKMLKNDAGFAGYLGAAPPPGHGTHRYIFVVTALPVETLPIDESTSPAVCNFQLYASGIARAFLTAHFGR